MNTHILDLRALSWANVVFWRNHAESLARRRQHSLAIGEGVLCELLEPQHANAIRRAQLAREEHERAGGAL